HSRLRTPLHRHARSHRSFSDRRRDRRRRFIGGAPRTVRSSLRGTPDASARYSHDAAHGCRDRPPTATPGRGGWIGAARRSHRGQRSESMTWRIAGLVFFASLVSGLALGAPAARADEYVIGPDDVLAVSVWLHPELERTVTVSAS